MKAVRKSSGRAKSMPAGLALGAAAAFAITLAVSAIGAKLVDMGSLKETAIGYWVMGILLISAFTGAMVAVGSIKRQKLMVCALSALIYYGCLLSTTALLFGGQYQGMGATALMVLCGGALAAMLCSRKGREGRRNRKRSLRHR